MRRCKAPTLLHGTTVRLLLLSKRASQRKVNQHSRGIIKHITPSIRYRKIPRRRKLVQLSPAFGSGGTHSASTAAFVVLFPTSATMSSYRYLEANGSKFWCVCLTVCRVPYAVLQ